MDLAEDVPQREVDAARGGSPDDAVAVPEMLAIHHLPEVLDPRRVLADDERREVLDRADDSPRVPLERRLAPAVEPVLVGEDLDEDPVPHARMADVRLDPRDLHAGPDASGRPSPGWIDNHYSGDTAGIFEKGAA